MIHHIKKQKEKKIIWSSQKMQKKAYDTVEHPFPIKTLKKLWIERNFFNLLKDIYRKHITNINDERWGTKQGYLLSPLLLNIVLKIWANTRQEKNESHTFWKGRNKTVFIHMIAYVENPIDHPKNILKLIIDFSKVVGYKISK